MAAGTGGGAWSHRGPAEHRNAGSRRHGERIQGAGASYQDLGTLGFRVARARSTQSFPAAVACTMFPTHPSSLSSNILGSRSLSSLPPLRLLFCE